MTIEIEVANVSSRINSPLDPAISSLLELEMSYEVKGSFFTDAFQQGWWDGRVKLYSIKTQIFPTGLLPRVRKVLIANGLSFDYLDNRVTTTLGEELPLKLDEDMELYNYQQGALKIAIEKTRGIIKLPTGGGKSVLYAAMLAKINLPSIIFIHRKDIAHQLRETLEYHLQQPVGLVGAGKCELEKFNIMMTQTASKTKDKEVKKAIHDASCIIIDEGHILPSKGVYETIKQCKNAFLRYCGSATPFRYDGADLFIEAATGEKIVNISASELIDAGYLVPPHIYMIDVPKVDGLINLNYMEAYKTGIVDNRKRNDMIIDLCSYFKEKKKTTLVAVTRVEHGKELIDELHQKYPEIKSIFVHGKDEDFLRKEVLDDLRAKKLDIVIATNIFNEGVNIPALDTLINCKAQDSDVDAYQLIGRVLRKFPGKKNAIVIDFNDKSKYLHKHSVHREKIYLKEPAFQLYKCKELLEVKRLINVQESL